MSALRLPGKTDAVLAHIPRNIHRPNKRKNNNNNK